MAKRANFFVLAAWAGALPPVACLAWPCSGPWVTGGGTTRRAFLRMVIGGRGGHSPPQRGMHDDLFWQPEQGRCPLWPVLPEPEQGPG